MKKTLLVILATLLLFTAACSGGGGATTTTTPTAITTATTTAAPAVMPADLAPVSIDLIAEGYPTDGTYHAETDYPYQTSGNYLFVEEANRYYFLVGEYLMYADADTMEIQALCKKEGCRHNDKFSSRADRRACDAYFPSGYLRTLGYQNGRIYLTHGTADDSAYLVVSINPDGTDRREELRMEADRDIHYPMASLFHRGQFYCLWTRMDAEENKTGELWSWSLSQPDAEPVLLYEAQNATTYYWGSLANMRAYGNYLCLQEIVEVLETVEVGDNGSFTLVSSVELLLDLNTGEWTVQEVPEGYTFEYFRLTDEGIVWRYQPATAPKSEVYEGDGFGSSNIYWDEYLVYRLDPVSGSREIVEDYPWDYEFSGDYGFAYEDNFDDPYSSVLHICDREGNAVTELSFENIYGQKKENTADFILRNASCLVYPMPDGKVILQTEQNSSSTNLIYYYFDAADIAGGEIEVHEFLRGAMSDFFTT